MQSEFTIHQNQSDSSKSSFVELKVQNNFVTLEPLFTNQVISTNQTHLGKPVPFYEKHQNSTAGYFITYLFVLFAWAFYYQKHNKGLHSIIKSFFSNSVFFQELNDKSGANGIVSLGMFLLGLVNISIFTYQVLESISFSIYLFEIQKSGIVILLIGIALTIGIFLKIALILCTGLIFSAGKTIQGYLTLIIISVQILGISLFPMIIIYTFSDLITPQHAVQIGLIVSAVIYIYRLMRSFILGLKQTNSQVFHIILYICALEILPLFVFGRIILQYNG